MNAHVKMDLNVFEIEESGAVLEIMHPIKKTPLKLADGTAVTVTMVGLDSKEFKERQRYLNDRRERDQGKKPTPEQVEDEALHSLASLIKSWTGMVLNGEQIECNRKNVVDLLRKLPDFRRQVEQFVFDTTNFLKVSAKR